MRFLQQLSRLSRQCVRMISATKIEPHRSVALPLKDIAVSRSSNESVSGADQDYAEHLEPLLTDRSPDWLVRLTTRF